MDIVEKEALFNEIVKTINDYDYLKESSTDEEIKYHSLLRNKVCTLDDSEFVDLLMFVSSSVRQRVKDVIFVWYLAWIYSAGTCRIVNMNELYRLTLSE